MQSSITVGECARMLLAACNSGDFRNVQTAISHARAVETEALDYDDAERMEVIREAGTVIREWMHGKRSAADRDASLKMLRHLVRAVHKIESGGAA